MSKSAPNHVSRILISDTADDIRIKIRKSVTDSVPGISYDPEARPGVSNLLMILSSCLNKVAEGPADLEALGQSYDSKSISQFKEEVAEAIIIRLAPVRDQFIRLKADPGYMQYVAREGADRARHIAAQTMVEIRSRVGLAP